MTRQVEVDDQHWELLSSGKTRGVLENAAGRTMKIRVETVGVIPPNSELWGHNLNENKYFSWEKSSAGADVYGRTVEGAGMVIVTEG